MYSLFQALYDAPFYWMNADDGYRDTALAHRGTFTEAFAMSGFALSLDGAAFFPMSKSVIKADEILAR